MNLKNNNTVKGTRVVQSYHLLAQSICHMDYVKDLDHRTYFLTVKVVNRSALSDLDKVIFIKINQVLYGNQKGRGSRKAALIICGDVEGSRDGNPELRNPIQPHFHALLILSKKDQVVWKGRQDELFAKIKSEIASIREVKYLNDQAEVWIEPFDSSKGSIPETISYVEKAYWQAQPRNVDFKPAAVFPFEIIHQQHSSSKWLNRKTDYYNQLIYDPRVLFSKDHKTKLSEEHLEIIEQGNQLTGAELETHIERFVRSVDRGKFTL